MTQTKKDQMIPPSRQNRPGQRQQERLMRLQRRRRRQRIWASVIVALVVIALAGLIFWQYPHFAPQQHTQVKTNKPAATPTPTIPSSGPATPPPLTVSVTPVSLPDGLKYADIKVGSGKAAQTGSSVSVQYTGWLASNGQKFDSSYDHGGQPFTLTLGQHQVIPGWEEGLVGMKPGGTRRLLIPAALAYGAQGQPPTIPANATLIFDVMMVSVQ